MRAITLQATTALALALAFPASAQDVAGTLSIRGKVMVSSGGEFVAARDGQPILAGQRIMVGDGASATVEYERDCRRSFSEAGVHLIPPGRCDDNDDRDDQDRSREREQSPESSAEQGSATAESAASSAVAPGTWTALATALGSVVVTAAAMESREESPPDHPISR